MPERAMIVEIVDRLSRFAHSIQFAEGLNPAQWAALRYVARANSNSCSPSALADLVGLTEGTVSQTRKALEAMGLIERHRKPSDRRAIRITVTQDGHELLLKDPLGRIHDALTPCDWTEQRKIVDGMQGLLDVFQRYGQIPDFGPYLSFTPYEPEGCGEISGVGCRCGVSGELFNSLEADQVCADFSPTN